MPPRFESKFKGGTGFRAAIVEIYQKGLFYNIQKIDFSGFYPSVVMTFNISPETTKILRYEKFQENLEVEHLVDNKMILHIPDSRMKKTVVIQIDNNVQGFLPQKLIEFSKQRAKIKKILNNQKLTASEKTHYYSVSWGLKVLANSSGYGANANAFFRYGDLSLAIAIVGLARHFMRFTIDMYSETKIETDTDGIYIDQDVDIDVVNYKLKEYVLERFKIPFDKNKLLLEIEGPFDGAFFYKTKNYILWKKGKIIKHGVTFLSSAKTTLFNKALDKIAQAVFRKESILQTVNKLINQETTLADYTMRTSVNRPIESYKSENCIQKQLAKQVKQHLQQNLQVGDSVDYVKTIHGYKIFAVAKLREIDKRYYFNQLQKLINIFSDEKITIEKNNAIIQKKLLLFDEK